MFGAVIMMALVRFSESQTETFPFQHAISAKHERMCKSTAMVSTMINSAGMDTVFFIYDNIEDPCLYDIPEKISNNIKLQLIQYDKAVSEMRPVIEFTVRNENINLMLRTLNVVVLCTVNHTREVLETSRKLDDELGLKSVLRHFSRWVLIPNDSPGDLPVTYLTLDNVALISDAQTNTGVQLATLLWKENGREWSGLSGACSESYCFTDKIFPNRKLGLNGRKLIVTALEWLPFSKKERDSNKTIYTGLSGDIMEYLSKRFNFSYQYAEPPDLLWGHELDNGTWTGIVGMLQKVNADMSSVPYAFNIERAKVMSFTYPILMEFSTVVYKKSEDENKTWKVLLSCFKWEVYGVGGGVLVTVTLTYLFLLTFTPNHADSVETMKRTYVESFMLGIMGPLQQSTKKPPLFLSGQVLFAAWFVFCMVMTAVYRGNLMAFLTVDRLVIPFRTIQELANQDVYDVGTPVGSYLALTIENSDQPVMKALWEKIQKVHSSSPQTGDGDYEYQLKRLREGHFAYIQSSVAADVLMSDNCDLAKINEYFLPTSSSMVFPLHSPLPRLFSQEIMTVIENGLYQIWYETWVPRPKICTDDSVAVGMSPLHLQELYSVLVACAAGVFFAFIVLVLENYMYELNPKRRKK